MLGKTIARLRKGKGLTQAKFADLIHVTQGAISQWETGRTSPDVQQMFILADFFGITVEELSTGNIPQNSPVQKSVPAPVQEQEKAPGDMRTEAKMLLESMTDEQYQAALQYLKFLKKQEE